MKINYYADYQQMSEQAKALILNTLQLKKDSLLCAATGNSPRLTYQLMADAYEQQPALFEQLRILKLDEWGGVAMEDPQTCEVFLQEYLLKPLHINKARYFAFQSNPADPEEECNKMQTIMQTQAPIDLCILGLGKNGHIAFNEPGDTLHPYCHVAQLSPESMQHTMAQTMQTQPTYGLTLGMADILSAKKIILLITGSNKKSAIEKLLQSNLTTHLPASLLWLHPDVDCLIDENSLS